MIRIQAVEKFLCLLSGAVVVLVAWSHHETKAKRSFGCRIPLGLHVLDLALHRAELVVLGAERDQGRALLLEADLLLVQPVEFHRDGLQATVHLLLVREEPCLPPSRDARVDDRDHGDQDSTDEEDDRIVPLGAVQHDEHASHDVHDDSGDHEQDRVRIHCF